MQTLSRAVGEPAGQAPVRGSLATFDRVIRAALLVLVLWPGHEVDLDGCRPLGVVTGYSIAIYQGEAPRLLPAVEQMQGAARKRGADTIEVSEWGYLRPRYAPKWLGQWFVYGRALNCEEGK